MFSVKTHECNILNRLGPSGCAESAVSGEALGLIFGHSKLFSGQLAILKIGSVSGQSENVDGKTFMVLFADLKKNIQSSDKTCTI